MTALPLKLIFRSLAKNRFFATINIFGLGIGLAVTFFSYLFVQNELNFESMHSKADHIYRVTMHIQDGNYDMQWARQNRDWVNELPHEFEEVKHLIRFQNYDPRVVKQGTNTFKIQHAFSTDPEVFDVFDFYLLEGDPATALRQPNSVVLTRSTALQLFGHVDVVGKTIEVIDDAPVVHKVTGLMEDLPANTHLPVNLLTSFASASDRAGWAYTYVLLNQDEDILSAKMPGFIQKYEPENSVTTLPLQPLSSIHLESNLAREIVPNGNMSYVYLFGGVGLFILLMSIINFINLNTSQSLKKMREIGVRKVLGSSKTDLVRFFLTESFAITLLATLFAVGVVYFCLPIFQTLTPIAIHWTGILPIAGVMVLLISLIAGFYPAFVLTRVPIIPAMKNQYHEQPGRLFGVKNLLVGVQLVMCIVLVSGTIITRAQFEYLSNKNLGINQENVLAVLNVNEAIKQQFPTIKSTLLIQSYIQGVTAVMEIPSREIRDAGAVTYEGMNTEGDPEIMDIQIVESDFLQVMDIPMVSGNNFTPVQPAVEAYTEDPFQYLQDQPREYILNETAVRHMNWEPEEAIGQVVQFSIGNMSLQQGQVVGVIKDYHQETLKNKVEPLIITQDPLWMGHLLIKVDGAQSREAIALVEQVWKERFPEFPLEYTFLDDMYQNLYMAEQRQLQLIYLFSVLAFGIAFLGIFGVISHALQIQQKEIAIRQILGATLSSISLLLTRRFLIITLLGTLVAIPFTWMGFEQWLANYTYRIALGPVSFLLAIAFVLLVLFLTIGGHLYKAVKGKVAENLRE